jgi:hypothetical protein
VGALRGIPRLALAAGTAVLIFVALFFAYVLDVTHNGSGDVGGWLFVSVVASLIAAALILRYVPNAESDSDLDNKPARRALLLSILALVAFPAFWLGLPFVLGVPALLLAAEGQARAADEGRGAESTAAGAVSVVAMLSALAACVAA